MTFSLWMAGFSSGLSIGFALFMIFLTWINARSRAAIQKQLVEANKRELNQEGRWLPVCYSSAAHFNTLWKVLGYEATGILFVNNKHITFFYFDLFETGRAVEFEPGQVKLTWLGSKVWPNGFIKWFVIEWKGKQHYFMVDAGFAPIFSSRKKTQELYDQLSPLFA